jgi:hypothetical protein
MMRDCEVDDDGEPVVTLPSGATVLRCISEMVRELQAAGHTITADASGGDVAINPPVHRDTWFVLDSNWDDVFSVLEELRA